MTRQVVVGILALLVLSLATCQAPPQTPLPAGTGQLLSERSQVFFQKRGQAAEEVAVNGTRAAGAGDEMWTLSRGRALLKFRDLWARLYDDTTFHAADVTPSSIKATLGSGAVLIGEPSQSPERVEIIVGAPPRVRVVLAGTLVMVAYIPAQQIALVRTFDGKVDVSVLASGQSAQSGGDGAEWVLVGPDGRIETPSQDDVRALARRAGIWDLYHEIEVDAAGFGPPASRIPAERVTMTFVEKMTVPPTRVAPLSPKPSPTPACRPGVLYCEDFEDGLANGWVLMDASGKPSSGWKVTREGSDYVFAGEGHQWATLENRSWGDYRVRFRLRLQRGAIHLNYRLGEVGRYFIGFHQEGLYLEKTGSSLTSTANAHSLGTWHAIEISGWGGHLQVYVDGKLALEYTDAKPLRNGTIAFETLDNTSAQVDDIEVMDSGPEPAVRPPQPRPQPQPQPQAQPPAESQPATVKCGPERTAIELGDCTDIGWDVERAKAVYLDGEGVAGRADRKVCPSETRTYELRIVTDAGDKSCRMVVEVRTPSKPVITDIRTSDVVSMGGLHEPECGSSKVAVSARVTSPYRLARVQMWRSDLATWSEMVSQGDNLYVSSQNFQAGHAFRVRAEDEFGDTTETDTLPSPCMRVGTVVNRLSGKCIDVKGSPAVNNEAPLQLWDCEDGWSPTQTDQRWGMTSDGFIQNALSGKCIDVKGGPAVENGSPLQLWDCEFGSPSTQTDQKWELTADGFIRSQLSGKCIDVVNSSGIDYEAVPGVDNEAALQLWDCEFSQPSAATDQRWQWR